jgi:hypothetical protein
MAIASVTVVSSHAIPTSLTERTALHLLHELLAFLDDLLEIL